MNKRFAALFATNFWGVMNDNLLKTLVCFIAVSWVDAEYKSLVVSATSGALVLPYLLFSPLAGKLSQYFSKVRIVRSAKVAEIPIMALAIAGFAAESLTLTIGSVLLMGLQSALYSPSKYGLIKDIGGADGISEGMGGMEAIAFLGMLLGTVAASLMADNCSAEAHFAALIALAVAGVMNSLFIRANEQRESVATSANVFTFIRQTNAIIRQYRGMGWVIHLLSLFWWLSASMQMILIIYCEEALGLTPTGTGCLLATTAIGITTGCIVGGRMDKRRFMLGTVPMLGLLIAVLLAVLFAVPMHHMPFGMTVFAIAFACGLFKIPLDAEIQKRVSTAELNIVLAYFNLISFVYIFLASATTVIVTAFLPTRYVFLAMAIVFGAASLLFAFNYRSVLCYVGLSFMKLHYRIEIKGRELLEPDGRNMLVLPSHRAVIDPLMLFATLYDVRLQPLVDAGYFGIPGVGHVLGLFDAIQVPDLRLSRKGVEQVQKLPEIVSHSLAEGKNVLFYPSGHITTDGRETIGARQLAYNVCRNLGSNTRVIAIRTQGLWGSQWSRYNRTATPSIVTLLGKSLVRIATLQVLFAPKRHISIEITDITDRIAAARDTDKLTFNKMLEDIYGFGEGETAR